AQIVIDAEYLRFGESDRDGVVYLAARCEIEAERLFEADARARFGKAGAFEAADGRLEQARRGGQEDRQPFGGTPHHASQLRVAGRVGDIERLVMQPVEEVGHAAPAIG